MTIQIDIQNGAAEGIVQLDQKMRNVFDYELKLCKIQALQRYLISYFCENKFYFIFNESLYTGMLLWMETF